VIYVPITSSESEWWNPFKSTTIATCLFQWGLLLLAAGGVNVWIIHKEKIKEWMKGTNEAKTNGITELEDVESQNGEGEVELKEEKKKKKKTKAKHKKKPMDDSSADAPLVENDGSKLERLELESSTLSTGGPDLKSSTNLEEIDLHFGRD